MNFFDWLTSNPTANGVFIITLSIIAIVVTVIYVVAFLQGKKISFWPPYIDSCPTDPVTQPAGSKNSKSSSLLSRRNFIATAASSVSIGLAAGWLADSSQKTIKWKMANFLDENHKNIILYQAPQRVCDLVKKMSGGHFIIELEKSENTEDILNHVNDRRVECGYGGAYYIHLKYKVLFFGTSIPFGLNPQEQNAWLTYKENPNDELTYIQKIYEKIGLNVIPFPAGATGAQMGGWFKKEINSKADFANITMRIPGMGADVLRDYFKVRPDIYLPAGPIRANEIAKRLADGTLDAAEWIGPHDDIQLGLHKVAKYYYYPGWWEPGTTFDVQVNKDAWNALPDNYKEIFKAACSDTHADMLAEYDKKNSEMLREIAALKTVEILPFNEQILNEARAATHDLMDLYAGKNEVFKEVYGEWHKFRERIQEWSRLHKL